MFSIIRNDITKVAADAVVTTANPEPAIGAGLEYAVYETAGFEQLLPDRSRLGYLKTGNVAVTPAYGLPARCLIHAVAPRWTGSSDDIPLLCSCYRNALKAAKMVGAESIAFPLLSTGNLGFPHETALRAAQDTIRTFLQNNDMNVILVVFDKRSFEASSLHCRNIRALIDDHYEKEARENTYEKTPLFDKLKHFLKKDKKDRSGSVCSAPETQAYAAPQLSEGEKTIGLSEAEVHQLQGRFEDDEKTCAFDVSAASDVQDDVFMAEAESSRPVSEFPSASYSSPAYSSPAYGRPAEDTRALMKYISGTSETFQEKLLSLIDERGFTDSEIYKRANIDRKLFSKIRCNPRYQPKKNTALALSLALHLDLEETSDLIRRAGLAISPSSKADLIVEYCIENKIYDLIEINSLLFEFDQPLLGA